MTAERWRAVQDAFAAVRALSPDARRDFLSNGGLADEVRAEVERLLRHHDSAAGILDAGSDQIRAEISNLVDEAAPLAADPLLGGRVGRYHVKSVIARGGMATVYEAVQESPHRVVALKVMKRNIASQTALRRFQFESQILARLRHPHIAQVFEAGIGEEAGTTGVPYFAMEYIPGARPITDHASAKDLDLPARLALFAKVCDAVHHGHVKGIIHRDLKPANILVDSAGEPKVIDFGVARATDSDLAVTTQQTSIGDLVGTMQYMSPEQCDADPHDIDTRSDVYSLGVVLYELLTGVLPYDAAGSRIHAMHQAPGIIRNVQPPPPSTVVGRGVAARGNIAHGECGRPVRNGAQSASAVIRAEPVRHAAGETPALPGRSVASSLSRALRGDVDTIVAKALAKDREKRYASAAELAADVRRFLNREPIAARRPTVWERAMRWAARRPIAATTIASLTVAVFTLGTTIASVWRLRYVPSELTLLDDHRRAQLKSPAGFSLHGWDFGSQYSIGFAQLLQRPAQWGGGTLALVGVTKVATTADRGKLLAYDVDASLRESLWSGQIDDDDQRPLPNRYRGSEFNFHLAIVADFLDEPGDEIVAVFRHHSNVHTIIRAYDLGGNCRWELWTRAFISAGYWTPGAKQLVLSGTRNLKGFDSGGAGAKDREAISVVFAVRTQKDVRRFDLLEDEFGSTPAGAERYKWLPPATRLTGISEVALGPPSRRNKGGIVRVDLRGAPDQESLSIAWDLDVHGDLLEKNSHGRERVSSTYERGSRLPFHGPVSPYRRPAAHRFRVSAVWRSAPVAEHHAVHTTLEGLRSGACCSEACQHARQVIQFDVAVKIEISIEI